MSKSHRKTPKFSFAGTRTGEQKSWKTANNKKNRRKVKQILSELEENNELDEAMSEYIYIIREGDVWTSPSDGKKYYINYEEKDMRK